MSRPSSPRAAGRRAAAALSVVALGLFLALAWPPHRGAVAAPPPAAVPATLAVVRRADVAQDLAGVGNVLADASVTVHARVDGEIESIGFVEGQPVRAGQVLARLDSRALRAALEQARAQQARDAAQLADARLELQRDVDLLAAHGIAQQALDTQRALVAQLDAAVRGDSAQADAAAVQLGYATIVAPISGLAGARLIDAGNIVHASDPGGIVVINRIDPIDIAFTLPGDDVQAINAARADGRRLAVLVYGRDGGTLLGRGELVLVNNQIDSASGTIALKARLGNPQRRLWPGQYVDVRLRLGLLRGAATVPAAAVQRGAGGTYVWTVGADGRARRRHVTLGPTQDGVAVIAAGLRPGERVVVDGQYRLGDGVAVTAVGAVQ